MLQQALGSFNDAVKMLSEDEQRELFKLLFLSVIVTKGGKAIDTANENTRRKCKPRRHLTANVKLRTEAIQTLFGLEASSTSRKRGFNFTFELVFSRNHSRESCGILSPIKMECGHKVPKQRQKARKTEHEIHRAIYWEKEMKGQNLGQNQFARQLGLSAGAVSHVMKWLRLSPKAVKMILALDSPDKIRKVSRKFREHLLGITPAEQIKALSDLIN